MTDLAALRERVAGLTSPDREVDAEIAEHFGHRITWSPGGYFSDANGEPVIHWRPPHPYAGMKEPCPAWTASLDAALALVERVLPGHHQITLSHVTGSTRCRAGILRLTPKDTWLCIAADDAPTPALALLLALLTALQHKENGDG